MIPASGQQNKEQSNPQGQKPAVNEGGATGTSIESSRPEFAAQKKIAALPQNSQPKAAAIQAKSIIPGIPPIQRVPMDVYVTGLTHLVKKEEDSIFMGNEEIEVADPDTVTIEPEQSMWSRRGPNQEVAENREADAEGPQIYEWYPALAVNETPVEKDFYLRDETFVAPVEELVVDEQAEHEGQAAIDRSIAHSQKASKGKPKEPKLPDTMPAEQAERIMAGYRKKLEAWQAKQAQGSAGPSLQMVFQSIGTTFEDCAFPFLQKKHPGTTIYNGLKFGSQHELDFVIVQGRDVIIYSAKLNASAFAPSKDLKHWEAITAAWDRRGFDKLIGTDVEAPPPNPPLVLLISAESFGLDSEGFLDQLVPNWREQMGMA